MHRITLVIILLVSATCADAAWYQKTDGTVVDPIQNLIAGGDHVYSGNNLLPGADLVGAQLYFADLTNADLAGVDLSNADVNTGVLAGADLTGSVMNNMNLYDTDLSGANLTDADLGTSYMYGADLTGANLSGSVLSDVLYYDDVTWTDAFYYTDNEPTWHSGMDAAWRTSKGISALSPTSAVPEPSTLLLALLGLALVPRKRRR